MLGMSLEMLSFKCIHNRIVGDSFNDEVLINEIILIETFEDINNTFE